MENLWQTSESLEMLNIHASKTERPKWQDKSTQEQTIIA